MLDRTCALPYFTESKQHTTNRMGHVDEVNVFNYKLRQDHAKAF